MKNVLANCCSANNIIWKKQSQNSLNAYNTSYVGERSDYEDIKEDDGDRHGEHQRCLG